MKKSLILVAIILLSVFGHAQEIKPVKDTKRLIITNKLTAKENYKTVLLALLNEGFFPEIQDSASHYIKTQPKDISKGMGVFFLNILAKDNKIIISGRSKGAHTISMYGVQSANEYEDIRYLGGKGSFYRTVFSDMENFSKTITGEVAYEK